MGEHRNLYVGTVGVLAKPMKKRVDYSPNLAFSGVWPAASTLALSGENCCGWPASAWPAGAASGEYGSISGHRYGDMGTMPFINPYGMCCMWAAAAAAAAAAAGNDGGTSGVIMPPPSAACRTG